MKKIILFILCCSVLLAGCGGSSDSNSNVDSKSAQKLFEQARDFEDAGNNEKAFELYLQAAELEHSNAQNIVGTMYEDGRGVSQNQAIAVSWYQRSAENGHSSGMFNLGQAYENGLSVPQDYAQAYKWYNDASQAGNGIASYKLALFHHNGSGVRQDYATANYYIQKSAEQGYDKAQLILANAFVSGSLWENSFSSVDYKKARLWYDKAAKQGNMSAKNNLALMHAHGYGGAVDYASAHNLLLDAAENDYIIGQLNLAELYELGHLNGSDFDKAFFWYSKAEQLCAQKAEQPDYCAQANVAIGQLYQRGLAVPINYQSALEYFEKAATADYPPAYTKIGELYLNGHGVEQNYATAKQWFEKGLSGKEPDPGAQNNIGHLYEHGLGVEQNLTLAEEWYQKAVEQPVSTSLSHEDFSPALTNIGELQLWSNAIYWYRRAINQYKFDPRALNQMGKLCEYSTDSFGCTEEEKKKNWFELAAQAGNLEANYNLGQEFERYADRYGKGYAEAASWYEKAAKRNHLESLLKIADMYERGIGVDTSPIKAAQYYLQAAELNSSQAQYKIGLYYTSGYGVDADHTQAFHWLEKSHQQGNIAATTELGRMYENGSGVMQDYLKAFSYYEQAALQADMEAQYQLGLMYINGLGTPVDLIAGKAWLLQAATKGHALAHSMTYSPIKQIYDNSSATAVLREDGSVITWGSKTKGGDSIRVRDQLAQGVISITYSNDKGFIALKDDGSVFVWGDTLHDKFALVANQVASGVKSIHAGYYSYAALKEDGSLVTWGNDTTGGDSSAVADRLSSGVNKVLSGSWFMAALKTNGELVVWGDVEQASFDDTLDSGVIDVASNVTGAVALKQDGTIVTWARANWANPYPSHIPPSELEDVKAVFGGHKGLALLNSEGKMLWWNYNTYVTPFEQGISKIVVSQFPYCYAAAKADGFVGSWCMYSGLQEISLTHSNVNTIVSSARGFSALKMDGSLMSWRFASGDFKFSFFSEAPTANVKSVLSTYSSFAALMEDGSVTSWGYISPEGVEQQLSSGVSSILSGDDAFYAIKHNGNVVYWGFIESLSEKNIQAEQSVVLNPPI